MNSNISPEILHKLGQLRLINKSNEALKGSVINLNTKTNCTSCSHNGPI